MLLTVRWGQFKPSQPSPRVAKVGPNQTVTTTPATTPQAGPLQAALPGPNQAVTATKSSGTAASRSTTVVAGANRRGQIPAKPWRRSEAATVLTPAHRRRAGRPGYAEHRKRRQTPRGTSRP